MVKIYYDPEGDLLEIQFARTAKARRGIGLTDQITLFYDEDMEAPLGLRLFRMPSCSPTPDHL
jgi:hypothetical protein